MTCRFLLWSLVFAAVCTGCGKDKPSGPSPADVELTRRTSELQAEKSTSQSLRESLRAQTEVSEALFKEYAGHVADDMILEESLRKVDEKLTEFYAKLKGGSPSEVRAAYEAVQEEQGFAEGYLEVAEKDIDDAFQALRERVRDSGGEDKDKKLIAIDTFQQEYVSFKKKLVGLRALLEREMRAAKMALAQQTEKSSG